MSNTVHYFGIFGRGDFVAIQFIDAGIEFSWKIHEAPLPAEDKKELYFGQLPCFEDEHVGKLVQSQAIIHYVSSKTGHLPSSPVGDARALMVSAGVSELLSKYFGVLFKSSTVEEYTTSAKFYLERLQSILGDKETVAAEFSFGDLQLFLISLVVEHSLGSEILAEFPALKAHKERVAARPNIAKYLASEAFASRKPFSYKQ